MLRNALYALWHVHDGRATSKAQWYIKFAKYNKEPARYATEGTLRLSRAISTFCECSWIESALQESYNRLLAINTVPASLIEQNSVTLPTNRVTSKSCNANVLCAVTCYAFRKPEPRNKIERATFEKLYRQRSCEYVQDTNFRLDSPLVLYNKRYRTMLPVSIFSCFSKQQVYRN